MTQAIQYCIEPFDLNGHLFRVSMTVSDPDKNGQLFRLPAWIPGSYMIREFAKNIVQIRATCQNKTVQLDKIDKHTWQAEACDGPVTVSYEVYAWDLSVRSAHVDQTHAFFNGSSVFLEAVGLENRPHIVDIKKPDSPDAHTWRVITALPEHKASRYGFGTYMAKDYDELIDSPVEMGNFILGQFEACGVPHEIAITGKVPNLDLKRIEDDLRKICETEITLLSLKPERHLFHDTYFLSWSSRMATGVLNIVHLPPCSVQGRRCHRKTGRKIHNRKSTRIICNFSDCAVTSISTHGMSNGSSRPYSPLTICDRKPIHAFCGCSKVSRVITMT